jgi:hypothetical protein
LSRRSESRFLSKGEGGEGLRQVTSKEISDDSRNLFWMLEQEHVTAALDLAQLAVGQSVGERSHSFG